MPKNSDIELVSVQKCIEHILQKHIGLACGLQLSPTCQKEAFLSFSLDADLSQATFMSFTFAPLSFDGPRSKFGSFATQYNTENFYVMRRNESIWQCQYHLEFHVVNRRMMLSTKGQS